MTTKVLDLQDLLNKPASGAASGRRVADLLGGAETAGFTALSFGDIVYDRVSIDPNALEAFNFIERPTQADIYKLATWSSHVEHEPLASHLGDLSRIKGSVFERVAATSLRQSGAHVTFPTSSHNPGWDFLVNGEEVQAKCGLSAEMVTRHLHRYPDIPRVVVSENLLGHFAGNGNIFTVPGASEEMIRRTTENSLHSAADMLEIHLAEIVPVTLVARNAYAWLRGQTDLAAVAQNLAVETPVRFAGAYAGHAAGAAMAVMLGGWPAVLIPVATSLVGFRATRALGDHVKRRLLLRTECTQLTGAIKAWCQDAAVVLDRAIAGGAKDGDRFNAARQTSPAIYHPMTDDWLKRLAREQASRRYHLSRFSQAAIDPHVFGLDLDPIQLAGTVLMAATRAGILPFDLPNQRRRLITACETYSRGLKRFLLRR